MRMTPGDHVISVLVCWSCCPVLFRNASSYNIMEPSPKLQTVNRDPSEEEMQLGDKIAALQQRVEQGEADQPLSTPEPAAAKENTDPADSQETAPQESDDNTSGTPVPAPVSYAAAAKPVGEDQDEDKPQTTVQQALDDLEAQLAKLTAELDDKVRFSKGTGERESRWK